MKLPGLDFIESHYRHTNSFLTVPFGGPAAVIGDYGAAGTAQPSPHLQG